MKEAAAFYAMVIVLATIGFISVGCLNTPKRTIPFAATWRDDTPKGDSIYCQHWDYVRNSDKRIVATVDQYYHKSIFGGGDCDQEITVWHNGADYGDFMSLGPAKRHAEEIAQQFGDNTY